MTEFPYLTTTQSYYDTVAEDYAARVPPLFANDPWGRSLLAAFTELVRADGGRPVADLGCGPGQVTAYLDALGVTAFGVDLSPRMVEIARRTYPDLRFEVGSMTGLDIGDGELGGIVAWWSLVHTPPEVLPVVFAEFRRTLAPGGRVLLGFYAGDEHPPPRRAEGHSVYYDAYLLPPDGLADMLDRAGITVTARLLLEGKKWPQACLLGHGPGPGRTAA